MSVVLSMTPRGQHLDSLSISSQLNSDRHRCHTVRLSPKRGCKVVIKVGKTFPPVRLLSEERPGNQ